MAGSWLLDRTVDNGATMSGIAAIVARTGGTLAYREQVIVRPPGGRTIEGERRYIFDRAKGGFSVLFDETPLRLFHRIALTRTGDILAGSGVHLCAMDRYDSRYAFWPDGSFTIRHAVTGPNKRYAIETIYTRGPGG